MTRNRARGSGRGRARSCGLDRSSRRLLVVRVLRRCRRRTRRSTDYQLVSNGTTPPTAARLHRSRDHVLHATGDPVGVQRRPALRAGENGRGMTIAIVDSYGSDTMAHDLHVFDQAFGLAADVRRGGRHLHGRACRSSASWRSRARPRRRRSPARAPGQEDKSAWALEVALDVETSHAIAPGANILLVAHADRRDARRAGLPADDEGRGVRRRPPPRQRHLAELRLRGGRVREHAVAREPALRLQGRRGERRHGPRLVG